MNSVTASKNITFIILGVISINFTACNSGTTSSTNISMPIGGTPFTALLKPGIGNIGVGCKSPESETVQFIVQNPPTSTNPTPAPTLFTDFSFPNQTIISGTFFPLVTQNPCFTGTILFTNGCGTYQSANIAFNACNLILQNNQYTFSAQYIVTQTGSPSFNGSINGYK